MEKAINIIISESDTAPDVLFVEIENDKGEGISIGSRVEINGGLTAIRITILDMEGIAE